MSVHVERLYFYAMIAVLLVIGLAAWPPFKKSKKREGGK